MAFLLEDVIELGLNEGVLLDIHQDVLDVLESLVADVPSRLGLVLLRDVEAFAESLDLLVGLVAQDQLLQLLLGVRLTDADHCEVQLRGHVLHLGRVSLLLARVRLVGGIHHRRRLYVGQDLDDGVLVEEEDGIV